MVQVFHDLVGLFDDFSPKHARKYTNLSEIIESAVSSYVNDVQDQTFPTDKESFNMKPEALRELTGQHFETV